MHAGKISWKTLRVLGFDYEHNRPERNQYLDVVLKYLSGDVLILFLRQSEKGLNTRRPINQGKITTDGRRLVDGITAAGQKNKRGSDVSSDGDIVDESNSLRLTSDTLKENSIHKSCYLSQSHSLGAARCTDGMSSQGTITANKYGILMEKI